MHATQPCVARSICRRIFLRNAFFRSDHLATILTLLPGSIAYNVAPVRDNAPFFFFTLKLGQILRAGRCWSKGSTGK